MHHVCSTSRSARDLRWTSRFKYEGNEEIFVQHGHSQKEEGNAIAIGRELVGMGLVSTLLGSETKKDPGGFVHLGRTQQLRSLLEKISSDYAGLKF